jgi:hypothetical protein
MFKVTNALRKNPETRICNIMSGIALRLTAGQAAAVKC